MDLDPIAKQRQREQFRKMAANNMKLAEVKHRIERDATKEQARQRALPGFRVQAKISAMTQRKALNKKKDEGEIRTHFSMDLSPMTLEEDGTLDMPRILRGKIEAIGQTAQSRKILDKVEERMNMLGLNEITKTTVLEYIRYNPDKVEEYAREVRKEKIAYYKKKREMKAKKQHKHIYPQELIVADEATKRGVFPKKVVSSSVSDVRRACFGGQPDILDTNGDERVASVFELDSMSELHQLNAVSGVAQGVAPGTTLGARLPMLEGTNMVFDQQTVSSLTMNHCAGIAQIQKKFDELYGRLTINEQADSKESERERVATPPPVVLPRVDCGKKHGVVAAAMRARTTSPTMHAGVNVSTIEHVNPDISVASTQPLSRVGDGSSARPVSPITNGPQIPLLIDEEMDLLTVPQELDEKQLEEQQALEMGTNTAPTGIYAELIRDIDSFDGGSSEEEYDPLCVICRANHIPSEAMKLSPMKFAGKPTASAAVAEESLNHWKAMHQKTNLAKSSVLKKKFDRRHWSQEKASRSTEALRLMTKRAEEVASDWKNSRGLKPVSKKTESIWVKPSQEKDAVEENRKTCKLALQRFKAYCDLLCYPNTTQHQKYVEAFVELLSKLQVVSKALFFRWLHACGPQVISTRENYRIASFIRLEVSVSMTAFQRWCKLPQNQQNGWKLSNELV